MTAKMKRREFVTVLGGAAAAWAHSARAQQATTRVIGVLGSATARAWAPSVDAFLRGLSEAGFAEGRDVRIEYRWAENQYDRLPSLAAELIHREVSVIAAFTTPSAIAAKGATGSGADRSRREPEPPRRQSHRCNLLKRRDCTEDVRATTRGGSNSHHVGRTRQHDGPQCRSS
jgi:hypothetical protein